MLKVRFVGRDPKLPSPPVQGRLMTNMLSIAPTIRRCRMLREIVPEMHE
jgi:hypothetical protein